MTAVSEFAHDLFARSIRPEARRTLVTSVAVVIGLAAIGCGKSAPPPGQGAPGGGGMPAMPVEAVTLTLTPVDDISEFVGTIKSRRSSTIVPQAEGIIRSIPVKSGDHVKPGDLIADIDA